MCLRAFLVLFGGIIVVGCTLTEQTRETNRARGGARPHVAILVSQPIPAYTKVARQLKQRLGKRATVYNLADVSDGSYHEGNQPIQVVAVGFDAASNKQHYHHQQIFCQVFNYTAKGLAGKNSKGVSMLPGGDKMFGAWKSISPQLTSVAVISGPGQRALLQDAISAAKRHDIVLRHLTVKNDKEYQYAFKQVANSVQGYWLIPDNRVLSVDTLRDVMNFSVRNGKQVVVFNEEVLQLGGLMSVSSSYDDIVDKVILRLRQAEGRSGIPGPELLPLDDAVLSINEVMANQLNLTIPQKYREHTDAKATP